MDQTTQNIFAAVAGIDFKNSSILALVVPYLTAWLNSPKMPPWARQLVSLLLCLAAVLIMFWRQGSHTIESFGVHAVYIVGLTALVYDRCKHLGLQQLLERLPGVVDWFSRPPQQPTELTYEAEIGLIQKKLDQGVITLEQSRILLDAARQKELARAGLVLPAPGQTSGETPVRRRAGVDQLPEGEE